MVCLIRHHTQGRPQGALPIVSDKSAAKLHFFLIPAKGKDRIINPSLLFSPIIFGVGEDSRGLERIGEEFSEFILIERQFLIPHCAKTIEPAAAGCVETGSPKGFPETRKPQASVETRERSDRLKLGSQRRPSSASASPCAFPRCSNRAASYPRGDPRGRRWGRWWPTALVRPSGSSRRPRQR